MFRKILVLIFCGFFCFSLTACGGETGKDGASSEKNGASASSASSDRSSASSDSEKTEETEQKLTSDDVLAASEHLVGLCDQVNSRIIVCDLAVEDWTDDNAVVWEYQYRGNGHIAGIKFRHCEYWGGDVVIFCTPGAAVILSYETKEILYQTSDIGWNPHSVELLPDGTFIVASSTDNLVCIFAPGETDASQKIEFPNAHGVLWDPEYEVLWMVGMDQLSAYQVTGSADAPKLKEVAGMTYHSPQAGMHDLAPVYGDPDSLFVTCAAGIMKFDKNDETFSYSYPGGKVGQTVTYAPGVGNFPDGVLVYTAIRSGKTVYQDWCTNEVSLFVPLGDVKGRSLTRKAPDDAYYKVRVWCTDYQ